MCGNMILEPGTRQMGGQSLGTGGDPQAFQKHTLERTKTGTQISSDSNLAAEAALTDTDMAAEMAEMTKHQILLQSGQSMLSQANQKPKNVLNLLRAG